MAVRKTESRLPDGYTASDLGQSYVSGNYVLISYLTSPITQGTLIDYVVFAINGALADKYRWHILNGSVYKEEETDIGVINFKANEYGRLVILVEVLIANTVVAFLSLIQNIIQNNFELDIFLNDKLRALGGEPITSGEIINELRIYINEAAESTGPNGIPARLLGAIIYKEALDRPKEFSLKRPYLAYELVRSKELELAAEELNGEFLSSIRTQIDNTLGICQIQPQTLAMVLHKTVGSATYTPWIEKPKDSKKRQKYDDRILDNFLDLSSEDKINLYNLLRFPKSNIKMCALLLSKLKNRSTTRWPDLTRDQLLTNELAIKIIATEYNLGAIDSPKPSTPPSVDQATPSKYGNKVFNIFNSPYLSLVLYGVTPLNGKVINKDNGNSIVNVNMKLYKTMLRITKDDYECFCEPNTNPSKLITKLRKGNYPVLEMKLNYPDISTDYVKIRTDILDISEGWVCSKWRGSDGKLHHTGILYDQEANIADSNTLADGNFSLNVFEKQLYKIRSVLKNYFDGESQRILPTVDRIEIKMEPASDNIEESFIIDLLQKFKDYHYDLAHPKYPYQLPNVNVPQEPPKQNNCSTFVEAILVKAWDEAKVLNFSWDSEKHKKAMPYLEKWNENPFYPVDVYIQSNIALLLSYINDKDSINEYNKDAIPTSWTVVEGYPKDQLDADHGHNFIIVDIHRETLRILTLESNSVYGMNGPGFRMLGDLDDNNDNIKNFSPVKDWWKKEDLKTWNDIKEAYAYLKMARLKVYNLKWIK